jgi:5'-3' exonuclease
MEHFSVKMASHLPTAKTLCCELQTIINRLETANKSLDSIEYSPRYNELIIHLTEETFEDKDFRIESIKDMVQCFGLIRLNQSDAVHAFKLLHKNVGQVLCNRKDHNAIKAVDLSAGNITFTFGKNEAFEAKTEPTDTNETLLLIDGSNLLSRGFFATSFKGDLLQNDEGLYTNGVHVFIKKLKVLIQKTRASHVLVAWDVSRDSTFRRKLYPDYKGLRDETRFELKQQYETTEEMLRMMNISQLKIPGYEADDIIGTVAETWRTKNKGRVFIYSNDKDLHQLLDEENQVTQIIYENKEDTSFNAASFKAKYEIAPSQWIDVKAILGETGKSSDNIPGVKGVGEKAVFPLIQQFGSLDGIYENLANFEKPFQRYIAKFESDKEMATLSKELVTIIRDIPELNCIDLNKFKININQVGKKKAFEWLGFKSLLRTA